MCGDAHMVVYLLHHPPTTNTAQTDIDRQPHKNPHIMAMIAHAYCNQILISILRYKHDDLFE